MNIFERYLEIILNWKPSWIKCNQSNIFLDLLTFFPVTDCYSTFDDHLHTYLPLVLLELWEQIKTNYDQIFKSKSFYLKRYHMIVGSELKSYFETLCSVKCCIKFDPSLVVVGEELKSGSLVLLATYSSHVFGYIDKIFILKEHNNEKKKQNYFGCSLVLRRMDLMRLRQRFFCIDIFYVKASLRMIESMILFNRSKLLNVILKPNIDQFLLTKSNQEQINCIYLGQAVTEKKSNLNSVQEEIVKECVSFIKHQYSDSKVALIQGPPGTGKTKTLIELIQRVYKEENHVPFIPKLLVCGSSNASVDEILKRIDQSDQCKTLLSKLQIVRIGQEERIDPEVKKYYIENIIDSKLNLNKVESTSNKRLKDFAQRLFKDKNRSKIRNNIIKNSNLIFTTLASSSGLRFVDLYFDCLIIDEAGQSSEPEMMYALVYPIPKLILIGDHKQLGPTITSKIALKNGFALSLFERFCKYFTTLGQEGQVINLLTTQYRMNPEICLFPSRQFYLDKLSTSYQPSEFKVKPYILFNILGSVQEQKETSILNKSEATIVKKIIISLCDIISSPKPVSVGVITFYQAQKECLKKFLISSRVSSKLNNINWDVNTVDGFQGQERDIIIISCTRSHGVGFLNSTKRLNVSLTRAKHSLILCVSGCKEITKCNAWKKLYDDASQRDCVRCLTAQVAIQDVKKFLI